MNFNFNFNRKNPNFLEELKNSFLITLNLLKKNFLIILLIYVTVYVPIDVCYLFAGNNSLDYLIKLILSMDFFKLIVYFLPSLMFEPLGFAALSSVVSQYISKKELKKETEIEKIIESSLLQWHYLIYANIIYFSIILISIPFFIIPAIFLGVSFYFCITIISLIKKTSVFPAMMLSMINLQGKFLRVLSIISILVFANITQYFNYFLMNEIFKIAGVNIFLCIFFIILSVILIRSFSIFIKIMLISYFLNSACLIVPRNK
ncbi:MAG: hypothetical protein LBJ93_00110 [Clostridiales bacterium]|jgi:hypothetical protein|nr:hypothetical protein [Clostridiales bacterium]